MSRSRAGWSRRAKSLEGALVHLAAFSKLREIVDESGMNDALACRCPAAQAFEITERPPVHIRACRSKCLGRFVRSSEPKHLVPGVDQLSDNSGTDEPGCAGDEYSHIKTPFLVYQSS